MKAAILFFVVSILFISVGCKKFNVKKELRIDIGTQFQDDFVIIKLGNTVVFSDNTSTNPSLGVAEILTFDHPVGRYDISVSVNGIVKTGKFKHEKNRFVYISFDRDASQIDIAYPAEKYVYD